MGLVLSGQAICHGSLDDSACLQPPNSTLKYREIGQRHSVGDYFLRFKVRQPCAVIALQLASFKRSLDQLANVLSLIIKSVRRTQRRRKITTVSMIIV